MAYFSDYVAERFGTSTVEARAIMAQKLRDMKRGPKRNSTQLPDRAPSPVI